MNIHLIDGTYELFRYFFGAPSHITEEGKEVDLMQDVNPRRSTPSRPTYESLGVADYDED